MRDKKGEKGGDFKRVQRGQKGESNRESQTGRVKQGESNRESDVGFICVKLNG